MKKIFASFLFVVCSFMGFSQFYEVTPLMGFTFNGKADNRYGTYNIANAMVYGGRLNVQIADFSYFELSVRQMDPEVLYESASGIKTNIFDSGITHYMVGFLREFQAGTIKPYGVISAGTSRYWYKKEVGVDENYNQWFFSTEFGLGAKMFFNDIVGLRLQASVTAPWDFAGGGMYWGIGGGTSGVSGSMTFGVPVTHWDLTAGLIIRIKD